MFGLIPRVVWSRVAPADDRNRVAVHHNCLLLESAGAHAETNPATGRPRRFLVEAGTGDKLDAKMADVFGLRPGETIEAAVRQAGVSPEDIEATIVTHMHFDHAGGLTRRCRAGETPHWVASKPGAASGDEPNIRFTFPNAELIVQRREFLDARNNDSVMTKTYYRDHVLPFEDRDLDLPPAPGETERRPRLRMVDSERPFPMNRKPGREELPKGPVTERMTEVLPGVRVFLAPGHTWGQQAVLFTDESGREVCFVPDVLPTAWHVGAAYSLAYDVEPFTSMLTRHWLLKEAAERGWLLVLDHEPGWPVFRAEANSKGWFDLHPVPGAAPVVGW